MATGINACLDTDSWVRNVISKSGLHAVRALSRLALLPAGQFSGASALAAATGAPQNYLGKLLQLLAREGLVESRKGTGGGFRLARSAASITLFDIVDPVDDVERWNTCFLGNKTCSDEAGCAVHERWATVRQGYLELLSGTTLADIVREVHDSIPLGK